ncbi:MAG: YraN family protein [Dokdonella sp.]
MTSGVSSTRHIGEQFELLARRHLERAGLQMIASNVHCRQGEIDLVMSDDETVVFVEVRYRRSDRSGDGFDSVGPAKRNKLIRAASIYLAANPKLARRPCRFDVVAVTADGSDVQWQRHAFEAF